MSKNVPIAMKDERFIPEGLHRSPRILVVDDEEGIRKLLRFHLKRSGCKVILASSGEEALALAEEESPIDLVLLDLRLPGITGPETLRRLTESGHVGCVIVMTAFGTMAEAITALKEGAYDFVNKTHSFDEVRTAIRNALQTVGLREEVETLKSRLQEIEGDFTDLIGTSKTLQQALKLVRKVANSDITVLIQGESGTGKELFARAIHFNGELKQRPFVAINCAAIPENLLESELFGHAKGAFTGAHAKHVGRFEEAHEGTLFLDEIGDLSLALQAKLLRVLQTGEIQPIGGTTRQVKVRIISATNQDLQRAVQENRFRDDLYYRLAVFPIHLPALKDRPEDIPLLVKHFLEKFSNQERKTITGISPNALERLQRHPWFGNVRELENVIYRAVVLSEFTTLKEQDFPGLITQDPQGNHGEGDAEDATFPMPSPRQSGPASLHPPQDLHAPPYRVEPPYPNSAPSGRGMASQPEAPPAASPGFATPPPSSWPGPEIGTRSTLEQMEITAIREALTANAGNMTKTAIQLNIGRATLYRKARKYGLSAKD